MSSIAIERNEEVLPAGTGQLNAIEIRVRYPYGGFR